MLTNVLSPPLRQRRDEIATALGIQKRGYFVPYRYASSADRRIECYPAVAQLLDGMGPAIDSQISAIGQYLDALRATHDGPTQSVWRRRMFSPRDAAAAYSIVRSTRPRRILEIGSGTSTWFLARAVADGGLDCSITCIDPQPRSSLAELDVGHIARTLRPGDGQLAGELEAGDILFIDSSHLMLPGMDVDIQFNLMFPCLKHGVIVHVHDIFLPYNYPEDWSNRMYSEQNALIGWMYSGYFEVLFPGHYATRHHAEAWDALARRFPRLAARAAGSMWLQRH